MPHGEVHTILQPRLLVNNLGLPVLAFASCFMSEFILRRIISNELQRRSYTANKFIEMEYIGKTKLKNAKHQYHHNSYHIWTKRYETKTIGEIGMLFICFIPTI